MWKSASSQESAERHLAQITPHADSRMSLLLFFVSTSLVLLYLLFPHAFCFSQHRSLSFFSPAHFLCDSVFSGSCPDVFANPSSSSTFRMKVTREGSRLGLWWFCRWGMTTVLSPGLTDPIRAPAYLQPWRHGRDSQSVATAAGWHKVTSSQYYT